MPTTQPIHYNKFKIEVYSPDGIFIKEAVINSVHDFYCSGLTPGQLYLIVFSYDEILLFTANFTCDTSGKVIYFNPAYFIFNNGLGSISMKAGAELAKIVKRREEYKVSFQTWERQLIDNVLSLNPRAGDRMFDPNSIPCYEAENDTVNKPK